VKYRLIPIEESTVSLEESLFDGRDAIGRIAIKVEVGLPCLPQLDECINRHLE
jgi:hypothetical protein